MLPFIDKDGLYYLPVNWGEVTTRQYCDLDRLKLPTVESRGGYFAGRPIQVNGEVADTLAFLLSEPPTDADTLRYPGDLGRETYLQVEVIRELLLKQPLHQCLPEVYAVFVARARDFRGRADYSPTRAQALQAAAWDLSICETYAAVAFCLMELKRLAEKHSALTEPDYTESGRRAREAGSDRLNAFGHLNVARHYAQTLGISVDAVYQLPYDTVALYLYQDRVQAEIQDNLSRQKHDSK